MKQRAFIRKDHFKIYDAIIPLFRLITIFILLFYRFYFRDDATLGWQTSFLYIYLVYALVLLFFVKLRELIVLRYPYIIGICETLIVTYGLTCTGGASSPLYFAYVLIISFFALIYGLNVALLVTAFCSFCFGLVFIQYGSPLSTDGIFKFLFLFAFSFFISSINTGINRYHIKMALYDQLTALHNRQYFYGELDHLMTHNKEKTPPFVLVVIDVNDFKRINDTYGHLEGDRILTQLAQVIKQNARAGDIAARYGGDEFVMLLPNSDQAVARVICSALQSDIASVFEGHIGVSVGYAIFPEDGHTIETLFHHADMAMYHSKETNRSPH